VSDFLTLPQWSTWFACAGAEWPGVHVDAPAFAAYLATHSTAEETRTKLQQDPTTVNDGAAELFLVYALHCGDQAAAVAFERKYLATLERSLARMKLAPAELDEVKQLVLQKLLVPPERVVRPGDAHGGTRGALRVEQYAGKGKLAGLVHVAATREALDLVRRKKRTHGDVNEQVVDLGPWDAGLELARAEYREAFRPAFEQAVATLTPRERALLRMHLVGGVTLEDLATAYNVHRATIVRWLAAARESILNGTKEHLCARLAIRADELESLMALAHSGLDVSVERLLRSQHQASATEY
jgi:RNA polymerase sigma-70 factor, ECF subfamily